MSGISGSVEMDTRELKQNKACFSSVIPKGVCAKRAGDLGLLERKRTQENKIVDACGFLLTGCLTVIASGHSRLGSGWGGLRVQVWVTVTMAHDQIPQESDWFPHLPWLFLFFFLVKILDSREHSAARASPQSG